MHTLVTHLQACLHTCLNTHCRQDLQQPVCQNARQLSMGQTARQRGTALRTPKTKVTSASSTTPAIARATGGPRKSRYLRAHVSSACIHMHTHEAYVRICACACVPVCPSEFAFAHMHARHPHRHVYRHLHEIRIDMPAHGRLPCV